jgi:beta-fructofuranosidase
MQVHSAYRTVIFKAAPLLIAAAVAACGGGGNPTSAAPVSVASVASVASAASAPSVFPQLDSPAVAISSVTSLYPEFENSGVGDPMPYSVNGQLHVFYLFDGPTGGEAFHPWYHAATSDFFHYSDLGEALPVVQDRSSREFALGTGSVIQVGDTYHAYYTGYNNNLNPFEAILHATSRDLVHWTKHPEQTFSAPAAYERNDFRDPHVIRVEERGEYWMLVTARAGGRGVIAKLVSKDLVRWQDGGVLFANDALGEAGNLEVPTLFNIGDYWYLTFSDQSTRLTQYRVGRRPDGPFQKAGSVALDGAGFYAGKVAQHAGQYYLTGWAARKAPMQDTGNFTWGGNLVAHQLVQQADGALAVRVPDPVRSLFAGATATGTHFDKVALQSAELSDKSLGVFGGDPQAAYRISGKFTRVAGSGGQFGFEFGVDSSGARTSLAIDTGDNSLKFFNVPLSQATGTQPQARLEMPIRTTVDFEIYINGSVVVMYVDGTYALTSRMYGLLGNEWKMFAKNANVELSELTVSQME